MVSGFWLTLSFCARNIVVSQMHCHRTVLWTLYLHLSSHHCGQFRFDFLEFWRYLCVCLCLCGKPTAASKITSIRLNFQITALNFKFHFSPFVVELISVIYLSFPFSSFAAALFLSFLFPAVFNLSSMRVILRRVYRSIISYTPQTW